MNLGTDIIFYAPSDPGKKREGRLFINDDGRSYVDFNPESWLEIFQPISIYYAYEKFSVEKYTFVNCAISGTQNGIGRLVINELYKGVSDPLFLFSR